MKTCAETIATIEPINATSAHAAATSSAPILKSDVSLEAARSQWSQAFARLSRLAALDEAIAAAKGHLGEPLAMDNLGRLKGERDALKRAIRDWTE